MLDHGPNMTGAVIRRHLGCRLPRHLCRQRGVNWTEITGSGRRFVASMTNNPEEDQRLWNSSDMVEEENFTPSIHQKSDLLPQRLNWRQSTPLVSLFRWDGHYDISHVEFGSSAKTCEVVVKLFPPSAFLLLLEALFLRNNKTPELFTVIWVAEWDQIACCDVYQLIKLIGQHRLLDFWQNLRPLPRRVW